jgi:regulation of enolase protein 1 (concanavalin A-like superfamily)
MNLDTNAADALRLFVFGQAPAFLEAADGSILMNGIGADIWGTADEFRYVYKQLTGDGSITARVDFLDGSSNTWAKGGVMIRQSDAVGAKHAFSCLTGGDGGGAAFQRRIEANGDSTSDHNLAEGPFAPPSWVRIERAGNAFSSFVSADGQTWVQAGDALTIAMDDPVLIGLALCSHNAAQVTSAELSNLSTTGSVTGDWRIAEIGVAQPEGNIPDSLYVALADTAGNVAVVTHPDARITARSGWTEWLIPYSDLAGVNLNRVATLYVGVGDRDNPTAGGTGLIFVDDIGYGKSASIE